MTLAAAATPSPLWYFTRATGVIALVLLTAGMVLGVVGSLRFSRPRWPQFLNAALHRNVSLLVLVFVALHVVTTVLDSYTQIGWPAAVVPFVSSYRPLWLGLGTVAFDLLVALVVTSLLRARLGLRAWRIVHWASYACWPIAVLHGLGTGTDAAQPVITTVTAVCLAAVIAAVAWRLKSSRPSPALVSAGGVATVIVAVGIVALFAVGPMQPGWAKRSGTPAALIAHQGPGGSSAASPGGTALPSVPFSTPLSGTVTQASTSSGDVTVTVDATGGNGVALHVVISGPPSGGGGVQMTSSMVRLGPAGTTGGYTGRVTALAGDQIHAAVTGGSGPPLTLSITLAINGATVSGTLSATP